ncbi:MAG: PEP-utilizing enzyme [Patescibacteria group bacterium]|nr:PEP-utilizing enzyme [Patescibacteria group bacterium]
MKKIHFEKSLTRDSALVTQQGWYEALAKAPRKFLGIKKPINPPMFDYINDGAVEIWESPEALKEATDKLLAINKKDKNFLVGFIKRHQKNLKYFEKQWQKSALKSSAALKSYVDRFFEDVLVFTIYYLSAVDERTPKNLRKLALAVRETDVYFEKSDRLIRNSLIYLHPELKGYENLILRREISKPPSLKKLARRRKNMVVVGEKYAALISLKEFARKNKNYIIKIDKVDKNLKIIKGQTGFGGNVRGVVRILRRKDQINEFKKGEVIVSFMTTPDFVPAMKLAAAFVTDEGGVTCHAAIIAREMKKPCVIGTKIATKVLRDGDVVIVDANRGIVEIIK